MKKDDLPIDLEAGVRSFLRSTIFAHPDDIKADEGKKTTTPKKKDPKKKSGR